MGALSRKRGGGGGYQHARGRPRVTSEETVCALEPDIRAATVLSNGNLRGNFWFFEFMFAALVTPSSGVYPST